MNCSARPLGIDISIQSFTTSHFPSLMIAMSKPAYLSIVEHAQDRPVIIFVPSRRQCRLTADDILTHCAADNKKDRFLLAEKEDIDKYVERISDKGLKEILPYGIAYYHEALDKRDKTYVQRLFEQGGIQVLIASKASD